MDKKILTQIRATLLTNNLLEGFPDKTFTLATVKVLDEGFRFSFNSIADYSLFDDIANELNQKNFRRTIITARSKQEPFTNAFPTEKVLNKLTRDLNSSTDVFFQEPWPAKVPDFHLEENDIVLRLGFDEGLDLHKESTGKIYPIVVDNLNKGTYTCLISDKEVIMIKSDSTIEIRNSIDYSYQKLLKDVLKNGVKKEDRTGTGTLSVFGRQLRYDMSSGFPALTTKRLAFKQVVVELLWFLRGETNIKYLIDRGCNIWNGDAYKVYERVCKWDLDEPLPFNEFVEKVRTDSVFAKTWGELGPIYGKQWRNWQDNDQIKNLIEGLKENPDSRRHIVSAWNVDKLKYMTLPPCHYGFQCYVQNGKLSLMWNQRSADLFLGVPFNIASYAVLLHLLCLETGLKPGELIGNFGDLHLYQNHIEQAKQQADRSHYVLPKLDINKTIINKINEQGLIKTINEIEHSDITLQGYESHSTIKAPLNN